MPPKSPRISDDFSLTLAVTLAVCSTEFRPGALGRECDGMAQFPAEPFSAARRVILNLWPGLGGALLFVRLWHQRGTMISPILSTRESRSRFSGQETIFSPVCATRIRHLRVRRAVRQRNQRAQLPVQMVTNAPIAPSGEGGHLGIVIRFLLGRFETGALFLCLPFTLARRRRRKGGNGSLGTSRRISPMR